MRLGMFMMPVHPPTRSFTDTLAEDEEKALYADQLGFDELWVGEHFSATTEPIPSPMMFFANLVARTKSITFGTAVINVPGAQFQFCPLNTPPSFPIAVGGCNACNVPCL